MKVKYYAGMVLVCALIPSWLAFGQQVRLPDGTPVHLRLKADLGSEHAEEGGRVNFEVARAVVIQGITVIPEGAVSWGAVQSVKKGKFVKFDIEGVQLPDGTNIKLRSVDAKAKAPGEIKAESSFNGGVGGAKGSEYIAYVDEDRDVAAGGQAGNPAPTTAPSAAPAAAEVPPAQASAPAPEPTQVAAPTPSPAASAMTQSTPAEAPAPATPTAPALPAPTAPVTSPAVSPAQSAVPPANVERVTVECFSIPSAADILIDGEFYGNTPSILKVPVGRHDLQIQLSGYKTYSIPLTLEAGTGIRTIRAPLEQKE